MTLFFRRFIGALMLDADAFEDIEAHRDADMQSVVVLLMACGAGGMAAAGLAARATTSVQLKVPVKPKSFEMPPVGTVKLITTGPATPFAPT